MENTFYGKINSSTSNFSKDEISFSANPLDIVDMSIRFIKKHWDDILVVILILAIMFVFVLFTGFEYDPENLENNIRKIIFRSSPNDYKRKKKDEEADKDYDKDRIFIVEDDEPPDTERYQFKEQ